MTNRRNMLAICFMVPLLFIAAGSLAEAASGQLADTVAKWNHKIDIWNRYYYISLSLVVVIAALGAISGMLQKSAGERWKTAAMLCAYAVTVITVGINAASLMDYREIKKVIDLAERKVSQLTMLIEKAKIGEKDLPYQMAIIDQAQVLIGELHDIQSKVNLAGTKGIEFTAVAHAAPPEWANSASPRPSSKGGVEFVGEGQERDLGDAKEEARRSFVAKVSQYILDNIEQVVRTGSVPPEKQARVITAARTHYQELAEKITANIKERDASFEEIQIQGRRAYKYYLLFEVTKEFLDETLRLQVSLYE